MFGDPEKHHIVIVANGEFQHTSRLLPIVEQADVVVAADGGSNWLAKHGRLPDVLVGDMDSVSPELARALERENRRVVRHPARKDETDTELALLEAVALGATHITVLGALGSRIDHTLANVWLLLMPELAEIEVVIFDGTSYLSLIRDRSLIRGEAGDVISLIPVGEDAEGIVTEGLEYPLCDGALPFGRARGISNVMLGSSASVSVKRGSLLVVHTPKGHLEDARPVGSWPVISRQVTITKLNPAGRPVLSYEGEVTYQDEGVIVVRCLWTGTKPMDLGPFALEPGDIFIEHYYADKWFNIFQIHGESGALKGWYCDITRPVEVIRDEIRWWDLALDLLLLPDGRQIVLDQDEFEELVLSEALRAQAIEALSTLQRWHKEGHPPFGPTRQQQFAE